MANRPDTGRAASPTRGTALAITSVASVQTGAAIASTLFSSVGPIGAVTLRQAFAAVVLLAFTRPWRIRLGRADLGRALLFGLVFLVMNATLYTAISRLPLATAITLEFLGPLTLAIVTATSWRQRWWAVPAAAGVALLGGAVHASDLIGVLCALVAAGCWAGYILLTRRIGQSEHGLSGLALATTASAVVLVPLGAIHVGAPLFHPAVLAVGLAVGVLSSAVPYTLDMLALRHLPTAVFSVLTSLNPAAGAVAGFLILDERLSWPELAGIALVTLASVGVTLTGAVRRRAAAPQR